MSSARRILLASLVSLLFAAAAPAAADAPPAAADASDDGPLPGHSYHGEAFNEGPRQRASLMGGTGDVTFPVTTAGDEARRFFLQGLGQVHGFWYLEAERSFRQAATLDPDCAIAYWGMAMANTGNETRAKRFIAEAVKRKDKAGEHERMYIDALDAFLKADSGKGKDKERREKYVRALEDIVYKHPDDLEAKAFLALQLWQNKGKGIPLGSPFAVDALLQDVLDANPRHPCHHYVIHLWDFEKASRALKSAALGGQSAPAIAHMWHMPGHIYSQLKRYRDAAWQQEASARVDHAHMIRDRLLPDQIHNFAHNNEWLIRNLIHVGRMHDAVDLARNMIELPRHPKYNTLDKNSGSSHFGRLRLFEALAQFERWDDLIALSETMYLEPTDDEREQIKRLRYTGRAFFAKGDAERGKARLAEIEERQKVLKSAEDAAVADAERNLRAETWKKQSGGAGGADDSVEAPHREQLQARLEKDRPKDLEKARKDAARPYAARKQLLEAAANELRGWAAVADGDPKKGLELLKKAGGVDAALIARVEAQAGRNDDAEKSLTKHVESNKNEVLPLAHLAALRWSLGKKDEAKAAFDQLRELSNDIDLDAPAMARLAPLAKELGYPDDWRVRTPFAEDTGDRPDLDTLGPFRWHPSPAPAWTLRDVNGSEHSLADYRGRPVVIIFYLGYGCLHCAQQLAAFAPKAREFEEAGIAVIAVSTDDQDALQQSIDNYKDGTFPFPLVSDAARDVFKAYRAHDDFEDMPLHGTFLVDAEGLVRWQDIGPDPFMDPDFLLKESKRLLTVRPALTVQVAKPVTH